MMKRSVGIIGLLVMIMVIGTMWPLGQTATAQDNTNLLINGSFEQPYYGQNSPTLTAPNGWALIVNAGSPAAFPHNDQTQVLDGAVSWNINQGHTVFTAIAYQRVGGLTAGEGVRASTYGWVFTCNDTGTSCIIPDPPYRKSDTAAGASLKIGIDPQGGTDPNSANIQWSAPAAPYDQWAEMSTSTAVVGDAATVFLYVTQTAGLAMNNVYWDKATLVRTEAPPPDAPPPPAEVPFVVPQGVRPDGSIVHTVQAGDTLFSIALAYREYGVTNETIAALNARIKPRTSVLLLGEEIMILSPGSVDPLTGQLIPAGAQPAAPPPTAEPAPVESDALPTEPAQPTESAPPVETAPLPCDTETTPSPTYVTVRAAYFPFERGHMFWREDTNEIYILIHGVSMQEGAFSAYRNTWTEGMLETDPGIQPPEGFVQPDRNFGQAWRTYPGVRDTLGWGTGSTLNYMALVVQHNGNIIMNGPDNRVYELESGGTWRSTEYQLIP